MRVVELKGKQVTDGFVDGTEKPVETTEFRYFLEARSSGRWMAVGNDLRRTRDAPARPDFYLVPESWQGVSMWRRGLQS